MAEDTGGSFYTETENEKRRDGELSPASEDYLEMICRLSDGEREPVRIKEFSENLHVSPSTASRTAAHMSGCGYAKNIAGTAVLA